MNTRRLSIWMQNRRLSPDRLASQLNAPNIAGSTIAAALNGEAEITPDFVYAFYCCFGALETEYCLDTSPLEAVSALAGHDTEPGL